jgi:hypothetical protein
MEYATLAFGLALPWLFGIASLLAFGWPRPFFTAGDHGPASGSAALVIGYGYFIGAIALTLWMRALSAANIGFGRLAIGAPLIAAVAGLSFWLIRRRRASVASLRGAASALISPHLSRWQRWVWIVLLVWLASRFVLIAAEVTLRPLYPWDAWVQWATKARVWYELGRIVAFVPADVWLMGKTDAYFDASPASPATIPLLQVWSAIALGHWDDAAMNWPWPLMLLALAFAVYGALRAAGLPALGALIGVYLVESLPFLDTHAALAGYADLMGSAVYTLAALAFYQWVLSRDTRDAIVAAALALACPFIESAGIAWALTLVPGLILVLWPRHGLKIVGFGFAVAALAALALTRSDLAMFGRTVHLDYRPPWHSVIDAYLLLGNWHLLWYAVIALAIVGARQLARPPLAPLTMVVVSGLALLFLAAAFPQSNPWVARLGSVNRATLHLTPLLVCCCVLLWRELTATVRAAKLPSSTGLVHDAPATSVPGRLHDAADS